MKTCGVVVDRDAWSASRPGCFTFGGERHWYWLYKRLGGFPRVSLDVAHKIGIEPRLPCHLVAALTELPNYVGCYCWPCFWGGSVRRVGVHVTTSRALDPISAADSLKGQEEIWTAIYSVRC
jgi:hypothetical protein